MHVTGPAAIHGAETGAAQVVPQHSQPVGIFPTQYNWFDLSHMPS